MPRLPVVAFLCVFLALAGCAQSNALQQGVASGYQIPADAIVLRVKVLKVEYTDVYPDCGPDCVPFSFWYKYRASVSKVISGDWAQPEIEFTYLQHAEFIGEVTGDCYVVLRPAGQNLQSRIGVPFVADKLLSRFFKSDRAMIKALQSRK
jgi:hypothetical protein